MSSRYIFDQGDFKFKKVKTSVWAIFRICLTFFIASITLTILYYTLFALFFSTDEEKRLAQENLMYEQIFEDVDSKEKLLSDVIDGLEARDDKIYVEIFHTSAPNVDPGSSVSDLIGISSVSDEDIVLASENRLDGLLDKSGYIESCFRKAIESVQSPEFITPPMCLPLKQFSFAQTGASIGERISPFYKVKMPHNGLDMIAPTGDPVLAVADGVVTSVSKSRKGLGNVVTINHGNGYVTRYAHLADIRVGRGRRVKKGTQIGSVGVSGNSFAPHLHFEIMKDTVTLDPVHYFFASVTPEEYVNILIMSASTGQSMD